jgi:prepilin-type N-terminal cleavage/methylation domain-containing protein
MKYKRKIAGFSLTEVLMAVGILGVGMLFIAGTFPVAIYFNTVAAERTTAAMVADEAFAKIRLYGVPDFTLPVWPSNPSCVDFNDIWYQTSILVNPALRIDPNEFAYPSTDMPLQDKQYYWSALCRRVGFNNVQVTVFVSRRGGSGSLYHRRFKYFNYPDPGVTDYRFADVPARHPVPVWVEVDIAVGLPEDEWMEDDRITIMDKLNDEDYEIYEETFINAGCTIVDDKTGRLYRVLERYAPPDNDSMILLDRPWRDSDGGDSYFDVVWVVPPAVGGGRYPCVAVYQRVIRF